MLNHGLIHPKILEVPKESLENNPASGPINVDVPKDAGTPKAVERRVSHAVTALRCVGACAGIMRSALSSSHNAAGIGSAAHATFVSTSLCDR